MLDKEAVSLEEERIRQQVRALPEEKRLHFYTRLEKEVKDPDSYAVLNYLFISGLHHFYLGKWLRGSINLAAFTATIHLMFNSMVMLGIILLIIISLFELYALFQSETIVQDYNNKLMNSLLLDLE